MHAPVPWFFLSCILGLPQFAQSPSLDTVYQWYMDRIFRLPFIPVRISKLVYPSHCWLNVKKNSAYSSR